MSDLWITVVIPTYNRKDSLRTTLDGLARQTLPSTEFEVVVVDDGSSDGTVDFLIDYAARSTYRLRPFTQPNAGPARARNRGMREAHGEIIVLIDDDVEPIPEFLEHHARSHAPPEMWNMECGMWNSRVAGGSASERATATVENDSCSSHAVSHKTVVIGPMLRDPKRREPVWIAWEHAMLQKQYDAWDKGLWQGAGPMHFYSGNASFRREWALAVGGFNEEMKRAEDVDLAWRMQTECGVDFTFDPRPVGIHRPVRSFQSWLNVADSYGRLDVVRARAGANSWELVRNSYVTRNIVTRRLADIVFRFPAVGVPIRSTLLTLSKAAYALGRRRTAINALSVVYNVQYLESACGEMGLPALRKLINENALD